MARDRTDQTQTLQFLRAIIVSTLCRHFVKPEYRLPRFGFF
jgi:hypothetical protein